jgi:hypothetical protein
LPRKSRKEASNPLLWIQKLVRCRDYKFSGKVLNGISNGDFGEEDIEESILGGSIRKCEKDELGGSIDGKKYVICGRSVSGLEFETAGKLIDWIDGETYFIITAYRRT